MQTPKPPRSPYRRHLFVLGLGNSFESFLETMFLKKGEDEKEYVPLEKLIRSYMRYYFEQEKKTGLKKWKVYESILSRFNEYCEPELFNHPSMTLSQKIPKLIEYINTVLPSVPREDGKQILSISEWYEDVLKEIKELTLHQEKRASSYTSPSHMVLCLKTTAKVPEFADAFFSHITSLEQMVQEALLPDPLGYYAEKGIGEYCALYYAEALGWLLTSFMEWQYQCEVERKEQWEEVKQELDSLFTVWRVSSVEESLKRKILLAYLNGRFRIPLEKWFTVIYQKWKESKNV